MSDSATSDQQPATVGDLTERELVARIQNQLSPAPGWLLVGIGDDAAVVETERQRVEVLTVDAIVEGIHFDRAFVSAEAIGHRALAVNLSDLAAMGAAPRLALLSMALPSSLPLADYDGIVGGFARLAADHRIHVVGGNLTRSPGPMMIDVTVMGTAKRRQVLTRAGAKPGDELYVSGTIGAAAVGLELLKVVSRQSSVAGQQSSVISQQSPASTADDLRLATGDRRLMTRYLTPQPRLRLGILLARNRAASACIDLSDGLSDGLQRLSEASGVGMIVDAAALPIDADARASFDARGMDAIDAALAAGDDYELLVAVHPRIRRRFTAAARQAGTPMTRIGVCLKDRAIAIRREAGGSVRETPAPAGYSHFR